MESMELLPARVRITAILKKALFSGEYKSGDELSLTDIAAKLGVSRTPVREAFQALEAEGLIELRMNKGAIVKPIDEKYITDHYEMRILLESEAAARAAKNGMPEADKLIEKLMDGSDSYELVQEDPLTMTAGTYSHPKRGSNYDEQSKEFRERTEQELKFGRSRGDR